MSEPTGARLVARIGKPHGLRGEVTVQVHTDDPHGRFAPGRVLDTEAAPGSGVPRRLTVRTSRLHRQIWLLGFEEIPDRTEAESLRGTRLVIDAAPDRLEEGDLDDVDDDSGDDDAYDEAELVGLAAVTSAGEPLGTVSGLRIGAAQDLLAVTLVDGRTALVPFVEAIVPEVDLPGGRVVLDPPPGLLDLAE